jgi:redox-sensing transcriptional repressor
MMTGRADTSASRLILARIVEGGPQLIIQRLDLPGWHGGPIRTTVAERSRSRLTDESISEFTTARLSVYLRCLDALDAQGVRTVSSKALAERFGLNAAQIRKDLANFGEFGVRGVGYYVGDLRRHLRQILGLDRRLKVAIIGAGNLGLALADYPGFRDDGFQIVGLFDTSRPKVGRRSRGGIEIRHMNELRRFVQTVGIDIAIVAVPAEAAQQVVNDIVAAGVRAILNFSPAPLRVPEHVKLKSTDLTVSLECLSFFLAQELPRAAGTPHGERT